MRRFSRNQPSDALLACMTMSLVRDLGAVRSNVRSGADYTALPDRPKMAGCVSSQLSP